MQLPSIWITSSFALLYLIQIVRHLDHVVRFGANTSWSKALNLWAIVVLIPPIICAFSPSELAAWSPVIEWMRAHILSIIAVLLLISEPLLRGGKFLDIQRLILLAENSSDPETVLRAARRLELHEVYDLAVEGHERALVLKPTADGYVYVAALFGILRRFRKAEKAAMQAISIAPELASAYFYLGMAMMEQGKWEEANNSIEKAVSLGLSGSQARIARSLLLGSKNKDEPIH